MHILALEYEYSGHHLEHLSYLLPELSAISSAVTVAVTRKGARSPPFQEYIRPYEGTIRIDDRMTNFVPQRVGVPRPIRAFRQVCDVIDAVQPDHVLMPSADSATFGSVVSALKLGPSRDIPIDVCLHAGPGGMRDQGIGQRLRSRLSLSTCKLAPWRRVSFLNPYVFETVLARSPALAGRVGTIPSPVPASRRLTTQASRSRLGLPETGRLLCATGGLSLPWKGVDRLLAAFRELRRRKDDRLLLAGSCGPSLRHLLASRYRDLIESENILVIDRFLSDEEIDAVCTAADAICAPYPGFTRVSGVLLRAVAAGKPVLSTVTGWSGNIVRDFGVGWSCDATNERELSSTLQTVLDECVDYVESRQARELLRYHSIPNFVAHWLSPLGAKDEPFTWNQLTGGLPAAA
jgi:glycosyltransferase involved in cell wall biosynthesis